MLDTLKQHIVKLIANRRRNKIQPAFIYKLIIINRIRKHIVNNRHKQRTAFLKKEMPNEEEYMSHIILLQELIDEYEIK